MWHPSVRRAHAKLLSRHWIRYCLWRLLSRSWLGGVVDDARENERGIVDVGHLLCWWLRVDGIDDEVVTVAVLC